MTEAQRIHAIIKLIKLPDSGWIIAGSGSMVLYGIDRGRPMGDLDIFVSTKTWFELAASQDRPSEWSIFTPDPDDPFRRCDPPYLFMTLYGLPINIFFSWRKRTMGNIDVTHWIHNSVQAGGLPCVSLRFLFDWKREVGREKDLSDLAILSRIIGEA
jgi:hypothetical protein